MKNNKFPLEEKYFLCQEQAGIDSKMREMILHKHSFKFIPETLCGRLLPHS